MARKGAKKKAADRWQLALYETKDGTQPAAVFLKGIPKEPRRELLKIVAAVAQMGPPRFPSGQLGWTVMRKPKKKGDVDMSGICEARDKHGKELYRLFCVVDRDAPNHGLALPSLVLIGGAQKKIEEQVPQGVYRKIDASRDDYLDSRRVAAEDALPDWWPNV